VELPPPELGRARFALARVLWRSLGERPRALSLAREALAAYAGSAPVYAPRAREVRAWLSAHGSS
jgi:eukaryotic-like serine/threonine-protein kinase